MDSNSISNSLTSKLAQNFQDYKTVYLLIILSLIFGYIAYKMSKTHRLGITLSELSELDGKIIISSQLNRYKKRRLCDFYIASAFRPYLCKRQYFEYMDLSVIEKILTNGVRSIYVDVYNSNLGSKAEPVISTGLRKGQWKFSLNTIPFDSLCEMLGRVCFSPGYVNNYDDPFILILNLNLNRNMNSLNQMRDSIYKYLIRFILPNQYLYGRGDISQITMEELFRKIVIISGEGYKDSSLEEFINYSWNEEAVKKISYSSLIPNEEDVNQVQVDGRALTNFNKNNLTIVTPYEDVTLDTNNYDPTNFWNTGCQIVLMNYQNIDKNLNEYIEKFKNNSFVLKPPELIGARKTEVNISNTLVSPQIAESLDLINNNPGCPEMPSEDYAEDSLIFKESNRNNGLCFVINQDKNCNTENGTNFNQIKLTSDYDMCCSNYPVNDLNPVDGGNKHFISQISSTQDDSESGPNLELELIEDKANFEKDSGKSKLPLYKIENNSSIQNKNLCLIDINNKNKKCPEGWTHTATTIRGYNVCCKNT